MRFNRGAAVVKNKRAALVGYIVLWLGRPMGTISRARGADKDRLFSGRATIYPNYKVARAAARRSAHAWKLFGVGDTGSGWYTMAVRQPHKVVE